VPGQPALQGRVRAAQFHLLASARPDAWTPDTDPATPSTLTVRLAGTPTLGQATLTWLDARPLAPYEVQLRTAGAGRTVATVSATADMVDKVAFEPAAGDALRLRIPATRFGGQNPKLAELTVSG
jgi:hypothetical protein